MTKIGLAILIIDIWYFNLLLPLYKIYYYLLQYRKWWVFSTKWRHRIKSIEIWRQLHVLKMQNKQTNI